jgi:hypothetical protein
VPNRLGRGGVVDRLAPYIAASAPVATASTLTALSSGAGSEPLQRW